jgi:hypothetical protein
MCVLLFPQLATLTCAHTQVNDFGDAMRRAIRTRLPDLLLGMHRPLDATSADTVLESDSRPEWSLREAEARLQSAFEKEGYWKWVQAVVEEADAEARVRSHSKERAVDANPER